MIAAVPSSDPTAIDLPFSSAEEFAAGRDDQLMDRPIARHRNDFNRNTAQGRGKTAARMAGDIDLTGHQTAHTDDAAHHQHLKIKPLLGEKSFFLPVIKRHVTQRRSGDADEKTIRRSKRGRRALTARPAYGQRISMTVHHSTSLKTCRLSPSAYFSSCANGPAA